MSESAFGLVGIYGGTFDPVHFGHLRIAEELVEILHLSELRFLPAGQPRLRHQPLASSFHRSLMLREAIRDNDKFLLDDREVNRVGESYSVESLYELKNEFKGKQIALCFILGMDAFLKLPDWYQWRELFELCHLVVVNRPGHVAVIDQKGLPPELRIECLHRWTDNAKKLQTISSGYVFTAATTLLDISATAIRGCIAKGKSARYLLPEQVLDYIRVHHIYCEGK